MKIEQLIYFSETARCQHIRKASEVLNVTPSTISHSISSLEGELQVKLFEKKGKNISLTKEGMSLFSKSERLVNEFKELKKSILGHHGEASSYRIGGVHGVSSSYITSAWISLAKEYDNVTLEIQSLRSADIFDLVVKRQIDLGVLFSPVSHPEIECQTIYNGKLIIVVNKNHPVLKEKKRDQIKKIGDYPANLPKMFHTIDPCIKNPIFDKFSINPWGHTITDSYNVGMDLVKKSNYWSLIPDCILKCFPNDFASIHHPSDWDAIYNLSIIWNKSQYIPCFFQSMKKELELIVSD